MFDIMSVFNSIPLKMLRDADTWLILEFVRVEYGTQDLLRLN